MFQRLTTSARLAVGYAESAAWTVGSAGPVHSRTRPEIEPVHLLLGLLRDDEVALRALGIDLAEVLARAEATYGPDAFATPPPTDRGPRPSTPRLSRSSRAVLSSAVTAARTFRSRSIGSASITSELLLLGLLRVDDPEVHESLLALGVEPDTLLAATVRTIGAAA